MSTSSPAVALNALPPQARNVPAYAGTSGHEAIELSRLAGLVGDDWQQDIMVDALGERADGKWASFEVGVIVSRQNGKGSIIEMRVLAGLELFGERLILWSAHETKTAFEGFRRMVALVEANEDLRRRVAKISYAAGLEGIEFRNGARLRFVARSKGSGRGFSADLIILDEAYALTSEQMAAMIPTLSSRPNPQIWYTSSPPLTGDTGDQLFALRRRALAGDPNLCWYDYGLRGIDLTDLGDMRPDEREAILGDRANWRTANPALPARITEDFISRERATLSDVDFARERLGIWPRRVTAGSGVIAPEAWRDLATTPDVSGRPAEVAFAVVVAADRSYTAIAAVGPQDDGRLQVSIVAYERGTEWVVDRMVTLKRWDPIAWAIEDKGSTASLWPELERAGFKPSEDRDQPKRGDVAVPWANDVAAAYGLLIDHIVEGKLAHLSDAPLNAAVAAAETRPLGTGATWDHRGTVDVAPLRAATNALWAYLTRFDCLAEANAWDHVY